MSVHAMFDTGAGSDAISTRLVKRLGLMTKDVFMKLSVFGKIYKAPKQITSFQITSLDESVEIFINLAIVSDVLTTESETPMTNEQIKQYPYMNGVQIQEIENDSIDLILSSRHNCYVFGGPMKYSSPDLPIAILTRFGWAISGPQPNKEKEIQIGAINNLEHIPIDTMINMMFKTDFIAHPDEDYPPEMQHKSQYDELSLETLKDSIRQNPKTGHYIVAPPWKNGRFNTAKIFQTVNFLALAKKRQQKLKEKFLRNPDLMEGSFKQIEETLSLGHSRVITDLSAPPESPICYLPNLIVTYPDKPGKYRICQDGAATIQGHSLNKYLCSGPDLFNNLIAILLRFRRHKVIVSADIKNFFYQIEMDPLDTPCVRYLWWESKKMEVLKYLEGTVHLFGLASSPSVAAFVLQWHLCKIKDQIDLQVFIEALINFYVDDFLSGGGSVEEVKRMKDQLTNALKSAGFELTKWRSNFPELNDPPISPPTLPSDSSPPLPSSSQGAAQVSDSGLPSSSVNINEQENQDSEKPGDDASLDSDDDSEDENDDLIGNLRNAFDDSPKTGDLREIISDNVNSKVLGVGYSHEKDTLFTKIGDKLMKDVVTKRQMLSLISSMYDPLGVIAPYILKGRLFFQLTNQLKLGWNDIIPPHIIKPFLKWRDKIHLLKSLEIPRWTSKLGLEHARTDLIIFCDASSTGYGFCAYLRRYLIDESNILVSFLLGKSRVVPLQMLNSPINRQQEHGDSIPRLELCSAKAAATARDFLVRESGENFHQIFMFSDSSTVVGWIGNWSHKFRTFENFRLKKIRLLTQVSEWYHIPTNSNPADYNSKGLEADNHKAWKTYHFGPPFLSQKISEWPISKNKSYETAMCSAVATIVNEQEQEQDQEQDPDFPQIELYCVGATDADPMVETTPKNSSHPIWPSEITKKVSEWEHKIRRIALFVRFLLFCAKNCNSSDVHHYNLRSKRSQKTSFNIKENEYLTLQDKKNSEKLLIRSIQNSHFEKEIISLLKFGVFSPDSYKELKSRSSKLTSLSPFLDQNNLMRAGGRFSKSDKIPFDIKYPIILPADDENVASLIRHFHKTNFHCTSLETFYLIRKHYFIIGGKNTVSKIISKCLYCQLISKRPSLQKMGDLPSERIETAIPFSICGADVFGDFPVTHAGRGYRKRWVLLITCFVTRAIALYPLKDMTLSTVVNALTKMTAQFPSLRKITSDNGSNFKGASREIKEAINAWDKELLNDKLSNIGIQWQFGPANSGAFGGVWERIIQIVKFSFKATIYKQELDVDTFDTILAGITGVVNRRPLTPVSNNINDVTALSPAHFIYPYEFINSAVSVLPPIPQNGDHLRSSWQTTREIMDSFWERFKSEYLSTLANRSKWETSRRTIEVGDLVLITEPITPRESWKLSRVIEILSSDPNHPRRFKLRDCHGNTYDRAVTGVVQIELN